MVLVSLYSSLIDGWLGVFLRAVRFIRTMKYGNSGIGGLAAIKWLYLRYASLVYDATEFV